MTKYIEVGKTRDFAWQHLGLFASAVLVVFSTLRLFYFARFDRDTALLLLSVADRLPVLLSTVLFLFNIVVVGIYVNSDTRRWIYAGNERGASTVAIYRTALLAMPLLPGVLSVVTFPLIIALVFMFGIKFIVRKIIRRRAPSGTTPTATRGRLHWILATLLGFLVLSLLTTPWAPLERIELESGDPVIGRVMGEQTGLTLILDSDRAAVWVDTDLITGRENCAVVNTFWSPIIRQLNDRGGADCRQDED